MDRCQSKESNNLENLKILVQTTRNSHNPNSVIDPALKGEASASLCESICGIQRRTGRLNTDAYDPVRQDDRAYNC